MHERRDHRRWQWYCHLMMYLPRSLPWIYLGGRTSHDHVFACDFREVSFEDIAHVTYHELAQSLRDPNTGGPYLIGLWSYDGCAAVAMSDQDLSSLAAVIGPALSGPRRTFRIQSHITVSEDGEVRLEGRPSKKWQESVQEYLQAFARPDQRTLPALALSHPSLVSEDTDEEYRQKVRGVQEQIRQGRFYQLNLLRYFSLPQWGSLQDLQQDTVQWRQCVYRFYCYAEEMSALFSLSDELVMSFSPERFVRIHPVGSPQQYRLDSFPVKGTVPRHQDPRCDAKNYQKLLCSSKDRAELAMIIDLMRHDVAAVCERGSVEVRDGGSIRAYTSVFHRVGWVQGELWRDISWGALVQALLPAGSITGAPKVEVMRGIYEWEQRLRGYFMGCAWVLTAAGVWDASVLIRTLHASAHATAQYAAGSGIVIQSQAQDEQDEVMAKCALWHH